MESEATTDKDIDELLADFQNYCDELLKIYYASLRDYETTQQVFTRDMRDMMVEYAVLKLFNGWERFLEDVFLQYMLGDSSKNGKEVERYVMPLDRNHAYRMIQHVDLYPDWADIKKVILIAQNFFERGGAFAILNTLKAEIEALRKIRNAIAHGSVRAQDKFKNIVQGKVGYLPDGISPAVFLIDFQAGKKKTSPSYFEYYVHYLSDTAKMIVEYNGEEL